MGGKIEDTVKGISGLDERAMRAAAERQDQLTKPGGALGDLEEISVNIAGMTGDPLPEPGRKSILVFAADHGVVEEGVSLYPAEVTAQMVMNFLGGGAAINVLARHIGAEVRVIDIGVGSPLEHPALLSRKVANGTGNIMRGPAMSREEAVASIEVGIDAANSEMDTGADMIAVGEMGIGNTTAASAVTACITGLDPAEVTGRGTGIGDGAWGRKVEVVRRSLEINRPDPSDPLYVLAGVGGFEIGGIAGAILACAARRRPVVIDGFISSAGALVASRVCPRAVDFMLPSHLSVEKGHRAALETLGLRPVIDAGMRLGEGTGAALAFNVIDASLKLLSEMATFEEAGVAGPGEGGPES